MLSLLEMSVTGGILIAAVVIIRALGMNKLPKKVFLVLWAVALCRLVLPFNIPSPASVYSAAERLGVTVSRPGVSGVSGTGAAVTTGSVAAPIPVLLLVWLVVAVAVAAVLLVFHLRARRTYAAALPVESSYVSRWLEGHRLRRPVRVRYSDQVDAPFTYGVLWPVIVLPKALDWSDEDRLSFILAHELAHIRRFDAFIKWILAATLCLHWFNPLVWVMYVLANRDLELSCDETVVRTFGAAARAPYALTLVGLEEKRAHFTPLASSFSKSAMEERIAAIMKSKKTTVVGMAAALVLVVVVTALFATSSPAKSEGPTASAGGRVVQEAVLGAAGAALPGTAVSMEDTAVSARDYGWSWDGETKVDPKTGHFYTQAQYDLVATLKTEGYEKQPIATFNRTLNAKLNGDDSDSAEKLLMAYELLLSDLPREDPLAPFVYNTMQASMDEYQSRVEEVYSGKMVRPSFRGTANFTQTADVFGDSVPIASAQADYRFTYLIVNQDKLTVGERDKFLADVLAGMDAWMAKLDTSVITSQEKLTAAFQAELDRVGKAAGTTNIAYGTGTIDYIDLYAEY